MDNLKALKDIESGLVSELEKNPIFIQLESLRKTIATFEASKKNGQHVDPVIPSVNGSIEKPLIPPTYSVEDLTWKQKLLYVINKLGVPGISEIVKELMKLEPSRDKTFLYKRAGGVLLQLREADQIGVKIESKKSKYFIKQKSPDGVTDGALLDKV